MNPLRPMLTRLGLTDTEASIYLAGLAHPTAGVHELTKHTRVKRPTLYHALETLIQKGLVAKKGTGKRLVFSMTAPTHLKTLVDQQINQLEERKKSLDELIPLLLKQHGNVSEHPINVAHYEGVEGIKMVVEEALYCKSGHWDILAPRKNFFSEFDPEYARYFLDARRRRQISARSLWEKTSSGEKRAPGSRSLNNEDVRWRNPRYLPQVMQGAFASTIILFDDKVAIVSSYKNLSAILITSKEIHQTLKAMFEGLWLNSEEY